VATTLERLLWGWGGCFFLFPEHNFFLMRAPHRDKETFFLLRSNSERNYLVSPFTCVRILLKDLFVSKNFPHSLPTSISPTRISVKHFPPRRGAFTKPPPPFFKQLLIIQLPLPKFFSRYKLSLAAKTGKPPPLVERYLLQDESCLIFLLP